MTRWRRVVYEASAAMTWAVNKLDEFYVWVDLRSRKRP